MNQGSAMVIDAKTQRESCKSMYCTMMMMCKIVVLYSG